MTTTTCAVAILLAVLTIPPGALMALHVDQAATRQTASVQGLELQAQIGSGPGPSQSTPEPVYEQRTTSAADRMQSLLTDRRRCCVEVPPARHALFASGAAVLMLHSGRMGLGVTPSPTLLTDHWRLVGGSAWSIVGFRKFAFFDNPIIGDALAVSASLRFSPSQSITVGRGARSAIARWRFIDLSSFKGVASLF